MKNFSTLLLLFIYITIQANAQKFVITGTVSALETDTPLSGVRVLTSEQAAATSNEKGDFSIQVVQGDSITFTYTGYEQQTIVLTNPELPVIVLLKRKNKARKALSYSKHNQSLISFKTKMYTSFNFYVCS